jgi:hypothetical protein
MTFDAVSKKARQEGFLSIGGGLTKVIRIADYANSRDTFIFNNTRCLYKDIAASKKIDVDFLRCLPLGQKALQDYNMGNHFPVSFLLGRINVPGVVAFLRMYGVVSEEGGSAPPEENPRSQGNQGSQGSSGGGLGDLGIPEPSSGRRNITRRSNVSEPVTPRVSTGERPLNTRSGGARIQFQYPISSDIILMNLSAQNQTILHEEWLNFENLDSAPSDAFTIPSDLNCVNVARGASSTSSFGLEEFETFSF